MEEQSTSTRKVPARATEKSVARANVGFHLKSWLEQGSEEDEMSQHYRKCFQFGLRYGLAVDEEELDE